MGNIFFSCVHKQRKIKTPENVSMSPHTLKGHWRRVWDVNGRKWKYFKRPADLEGGGWWKWEKFPSTPAKLCICFYYPAREKNFSHRTHELPTRVLVSPCLSPAVIKKKNCEWTISRMVMEFYCYFLGYTCSVCLWIICWIMCDFLDFLLERLKGLEKVFFTTETSSWICTFVE